MNEPWTYGVLKRLSVWLSRSTKILLVDEKRTDDLKAYKQANMKVMVIGDSESEELMSARLLGFESIKVNKFVPQARLRAFLEDEASL